MDDDSIKTTDNTGTKCVQEQSDGSLPDLLVGQGCPLSPQCITASESEHPGSHFFTQRMAADIFHSDHPEPVLIQLPESVDLPQLNDSGVPASPDSGAVGLANYKCGEIYIHKSGTVRMCLGGLMLDFNNTPGKSYYQNAAYIDKDKKTCNIVTEIKAKYIATPSISFQLKL